MPATISSFPFGNGFADSNAILVPFYGNASAINVTVLAQDILRAVPFTVAQPVVIDGLAFENTGTADTGEKMRLGIYTSTTGGLPGTLLSETGEITIDNTRDVRIGALGAAQTLAPFTKYWLAQVSNATMSILTVSPASAGVPMEALNTQIGAPVWNAGLPHYDGTNYAINCVAVSHSYGALPSSFGTPTSAPLASPILGAQVQ